MNELLCPSSPHHVHLGHIAPAPMSDGSPSSRSPLESGPRSPLQASAHSLDRNHSSGDMIQHRSSRKSTRPATAPAVSREDQVLLPSKPLIHQYNNPWPSSSTSSLESDQDNASDSSRKQTNSLHSMKTVLEEEIDIPGSLQFGLLASLMT